MNTYRMFSASNPNYAQLPSFFWGCLDCNPLRDNHLSYRSCLQPPNGILVSSRRKVFNKIMSPCSLMVGKASSPSSESRQKPQEAGQLHCSPGPASGIAGWDACATGLGHRTKYWHDCHRSYWPLLLKGIPNCFSFRCATCSSSASYEHSNS